MRAISKDVVWARTSFSVDPLAAQSMGYTTVGLTLRRGRWSFGHLSFSHCLLASGKGTRAGCPILPGQVAPEVDFLEKGEMGSWQMGAPVRPWGSEQDTDSITVPCPWVQSQGAIQRMPHQEPAW